MSYQKLYESNFPESEVIWVDAGALFGDFTMADGKIRTQGLIDGYNKIGFSAFNVTYRDLFSDFEYFLKMQSRAKFPFISGNWVYEDSQEVVTGTPYVIKEYGEGNKIAFLGLDHSSPGLKLDLPDGRILVVTDPIEAARRWIPEIRKQCPLVVLLVRMDKAEVRELLRSVEGIDFVLATYGSDYTTSINYENQTPYFFDGDQGRRMQEIRVFTEDDGGFEHIESQNHSLGDIYKDDVEMDFFVAGVLGDAQEAINKAANSTDTPMGATPSLYTSARPVYAGSAVCKSCHPKAYAVWSKGLHSRAFDTLKSSNQDFNPRCLPCHVLGYKKSGGFKNFRTTPELAGVHCESCHGASEGHSRYPKDIRPTQETAGGYCTQCHDSIQSPKYEANSYLEKIRHW